MNAHRRQANLARTLLTKDECVAMSRKRPLRVYADLAMIYAMILIAFALLSTGFSLSSHMVAFVIIGTRQYALFILGHDGVHRNLHPRARVNDTLTRWVIFAPLGMALEGGRANHLAHHRLLGFHDDPDRYLHRAENKNTAVKFLLFLTGLRTFWITVWKVARPAAAPSGSTTERSSGLYPSLIKPRIPVVVVQAIIFAGTAWIFPWWYYPLFWLAPIYFLVFVPDEIRAFCDHAHPVVPDTAADEMRLITYAPPVWERVLLSPMNMNFHAEHHLWPFIPYFHLPRVHRLLRQRAGNEVIIRLSYGLFLWRYLRSLPLTEAASDSRPWYAAPASSISEATA